MYIALDRVSKAFGDRTVLKDFSLTLRDRERYCFTAPSGGGKTTLLRLIAGLEQPDGGRITRSADFRPAWQYQEDRLPGWFTAARNIAWTAGSESEALRWLEKAGLRDAAKLYPGELSGGMRRRVSLLRALAAESNVLILDEPLRELDAAAEARMLTLIDEAARDKMLLLVTHQEAQAQQLGCRMISL